MSWWVPEDSGLGGYCCPGGRPCCLASEDTGNETGALWYPSVKTPQGICFWEILVAILPTLQFKKLQEESN